jgi:hypothetical protein
MLAQTPRDDRAYRVYTTATLSDFPLLIGEVLRRNEVRSRKRARRQAHIRQIKRLFGIL